jgi:hypothetical protein
MTCALLSRDGPCISAVVCLGVITLSSDTPSQGPRRQRQSLAMNASARRAGSSNETDSRSWSAAGPSSTGRKVMSTPANPAFKSPGCNSTQKRRQSTDLLTESVKKRNCVRSQAIFKPQTQADKKQDVPDSSASGSRPRKLHTYPCRRFSTAHGSDCAVLGFRRRHRVRQSTVHGLHDAEAARLA